MLTLNSTFEQDVVSPALATLANELAKASHTRANSTQSDIEERKLHYVQDSVHPTSPANLTRSISQFLASNHARSNHNNIEEFLRPMKRRRVDESLTSPAQHDSSSSGDVCDEPLPTCARTRAIRVNRDIQMKYDIVKNDEGPLGKTMHGTFKDPVEVLRNAPEQGAGGVIGDSRKGVPILDRHPGFTERFKNIEEHLAIRYIPRPPEDIRLRLKTIEDHIIRLEKDYPPWAALHFNQPRRDWPPPPPSTLIVIPSHLTIPDPTVSSSSAVPQAPSSAPVSTLSSSVSTSLHVDGLTSSPALLAPVSTKGKMKAKPSRMESSLYRAVMEKLEVSKALSEGARVAELDDGKH
ncbi:uncharacterized protein EI90DRAFT_2988706 [Cantharellus anzutake]|uniref:uncharacterized protein n=1 Tax=Cantharellus anzutake TaxID=1750568 RepID=UPI0019041C1D|nr:uncharacterized protein EI90DRAFT_2988706 [Cantharellus anzutake]KAF8342199.1 hypothetical protein EI90DRAFT_2988706 [Cantharellus anzutake]